MKLYHGSKNIIKEPKVKGSNPTNDYGPCFYLTKDYENACIWACRNDYAGFVNEYEVNLKDLKILDLTDKNKYSVLNWIAILLKFRELEHIFKRLNQSKIDAIIKKYYVDVDDYDVIIGYRADDAYFRFPKEFISGNISVEDLEQVFKLGELGIQYAFVSERAIKRLHFIKAKQLDDKYEGIYYSQVSKATSLFDEILKNTIDSNKGTRIGDILK